jgi:hypothetical protein
MGGGVKMRRGSDPAGESRSFGGQFDTTDGDSATDRVNSTAGKTPMLAGRRTENSNLDR